MITTLNTQLEQGKNYLLIFDLPPMNPDVLQRVGNSVEMRNAFIEEYQSSSSFELLDTAAKTPSNSQMRNQLCAVVKIDAGMMLKRVCEIVISLVGIVTGVYMPIRFRFAEVTTVGI